MIRSVSISVRKVALVLLSVFLVQSSALAYGVYGLPERLSDRVEMSILVASPSADDVYTLYGHAGFRVQDHELGLDVTINYGIFDFSDGFMLRFLRGKTDYMVVPQPTDSYMAEYLERGSRVTELVLNMPSQAVDVAWKTLLRDIDPAHRVYRYNFFYNNCSTRPFEIYEQAITSAFVLPPTSVRPDDTLPCQYHFYIKGDDAPRTTWRAEINALEAKQPWLVLGTDLLLGTQTDTDISRREMAFLPHHLESLLEATYYTESDTLEREGVGVKRGAYYPALKVVNHYEPSALSSPIEATWVDYIGHPLTVFGALASLAFVSLYQACRKRRYCMPFHYTVLALAGLAGGLIFYIAVLSEHPHRWPNYSLLVLHPLHLLLAIPLMRLRGAYRLAYLYHFTNFVVQCAFLLSSLVWSAYFNGALYLIALTLGLLSLCYVVVESKLPRSTSVSVGVDR